MNPRLNGTVVRGFGSTLARSLSVMIVGIAVIAVVPVVLEEAGVISQAASYGMYGGGLIVVLVLLFNEMWMRGTVEVSASGLVATQKRLLRRRPATLNLPWTSVRTFRFDTDPQGRPYVQVMPSTGPDLSFYGSASPDGLAAFRTFEAAFREAVAGEAAATAPGPAERAGIAEAPSFYSAPWVRVGSVALLVGALGLTVALFSTGAENAWRSLWLLLIVLGFVARVWLPRPA